MFYKRYYKKDSFPIISDVTRDFYPNPLPNFVYSSRQIYQLIVQKPYVWRTFNQSEMNGESFYYQQVVTKKAIFRTTFEKEKGAMRSWEGKLGNVLCSYKSLIIFQTLDYYEYLINLPEGGIEVHRRVNIQSLNDVADVERGLETCRGELIAMLTSANNSQRSVYKQIIYELRTNSTAFVSGAAGTGKSFVLRMLERHYRLKGYKVSKNIMMR